MKDSSLKGVMMPKIKKAVNGKGQHGFSHWCPGCQERHFINVDMEEYRARWSFNGDAQKPTFSPSVNIRVFGGSRGTDVKEVCHYFLKDGQLQYLSDCTHELKGKTVELPDLPGVDL
jgi:hypothetical protein